MKKIGFAFSCISILMGITTVIVTSILNEIMPKMGRVAFQTVTSGSYSPSVYLMDFTFANVLSVIMIIVGILGAYLSIYSLKDKRMD